MVPSTRSWGASPRRGSCWAAADTGPAAHTGAYLVSNCPTKRNIACHMGGGGGAFRLSGCSSEGAEPARAGIRRTATDHISPNLSLRVLWADQRRSAGGVELEMRQPWFSAERGVKGMCFPKASEGSTCCAWRIRKVPSDYPGSMRSCIAPFKQAPEMGVPRTHGWETKCTTPSSASRGARRWSAGGAFI
jgi:hypothetical protein